MIDLQQRYETIKSVCENLKLQTKPKVRKIPSWCLDKLPCDAQILGDDGMYSYVYH